VQPAAHREVGLLFADRTQRQEHRLKRGLGLLRGFATVDKLPQQGPLTPHALGHFDNLFDGKAEFVFKMPHKVLPISILSWDDAFLDIRRELALI
jgi:hypothetical protein